MSWLSDAEKDVFRRLLKALDGTKNEFIVVGGQAARLFRYHPWARTVDWQPILTSDIDVATDDKGHRAGVDLGARVNQQGFEGQMEGDDRPPRTLYVSASGNAEIEFITPDRPKRNPTGVTIDVLGISAKKVPHLEILLVEPCVVTVPDVGDVRVPSPASYILQKTLTLTNRRTKEQRGKDALYAHDALQLFSTPQGVLAEVVAQASHVRSTLGRKQLAELQLNAAKLSDPRTDFVAEASRQAAAAGRRGQGTEAIALANKLGFRDLGLLPNP